MKPEHTKYILENIDKKTLKKISEELNIKERKIRKFLKKEGGKKRQVDSKKEAWGPVIKKGMLASAILIIILGFAVYCNSLNGEFLWDDNHLIIDNVFIKDWSNIAKIFTEDIGAGAGRTSNFYRPLQMITYMLDYSLWKFNVKGYHLTNILLHTFVALAIYWLINILYNDKSLSLLTSVLFVIHPIHTGAIDYISGRSDPLGVGFMILCFILYLKYLDLERLWVYASALLCYILALLSREHGLILPALLLLYHYTMRKKIKLKIFLPVLIITFLYILMRVTLLKSLLPDVSSTISQRTPGFFVAITNYIRLILLPFDLHVEYGSMVFRYAHPKAILGIIIISALLIYAFRRRNSNSLISFSIFWFFTTLLPVSNIFPINAYMAEHWLYLPSIGFFLVLANGLIYIYRIRNFRIFAIVFMVVLSVFYSSLTIRQNNYWKEPKAFYERTLKYAPYSYKSYNSLGVIAKKNGNQEQAIDLFKKTIEIDPYYPRAHYNLGNVYKDMKATEEAIASYKKAIEIDPAFTEAYNNLGNVYAELGKLDEAIALFKKTVEINPRHAKAYYNLGNTYKEMGKKEEAIALYKKAIEINPTFSEAYNNLGMAYRELGRQEEAINSFKKALQITPNNTKIYYNLGGIYNAIGNKEEAIASFKKAVELNPGLVDAYNNLGIIYAGIGNQKEAIDSFKKAVEVNPDYAMAHKNLAVAYYNNKQYDLAIRHCDMARKLGYNVPPEFLQLLEPHRR